MVDEPMMVDLGASLGMFFGCSMRTAMDVYSKLSQLLNFNAVEIRFEKEQHRPSLCHSEVDLDVKQFLSQYTKKGVHLPFINLNLIANSPEVRLRSIDYLKGSVRAASELGFDYAVMHARGKNSDLDPQRVMEEWEHVILELTNFAADHSIQLTIENADALLNLEVLTNIVASIDSKNLKITLDIGHAYSRILSADTHMRMMSYLLKATDVTCPRFIGTRYMPFETYGSIQNYILKEKQYIYNIHLHDNDGLRDHKNIGCGKINFEFLSQIKSIVKGPIIFETDSTNPNDLIESYKRAMEIMA